MGVGVELLRLGLEVVIGNAGCWFFEDAVSAARTVTNSSETPRSHLLRYMAASRYRVKVTLRFSCCNHAISRRTGHGV
jgi:hypothetical protein